MEEATETDVSDAPIVQLVRSLIEQAVRQRASDIHIEALETKVRVRYRIDGALYEKCLRQQSPSGNLHPYQDYGRDGHFGKKKAAGRTYVRYG